MFISSFVLEPAVTAVRTLTVLPIPGKDTNAFCRSFLYFPVAGAIIALLSTLLLFLFSLLTVNWNPLIPATVVLLFTTWLTGALHLDGLADCADGFGGGKTVEQRLLIMKDPRQGTFGVAAIVFDLLLKSLLMSQLFLIKAWPALFFALFFSRSIQPLFMVLFPYARKEGGTAAPFVIGSHRQLFALIAMALGIVPAFFVFPLGVTMIFMVTLLLLLLWGLHCMKKIGGITGDCIGAGNELTELIILLGLCLCLS